MADTNTNTNDSGAWNWIKNNIAVIVMPLISGAIALAVAYGANEREKAAMETRILALETKLSERTLELKSLTNKLDSTEDSLREEIREVERTVIDEGRELERNVTRLEVRLENILRRLALFDGIGAPSGSLGIMSAPSSETVPNWDDFDPRSNEGVQ